MRNRIYIFTLVLCCTIMIGLVSCNVNEDKIPQENILLPAEDHDFVIYDISVESDYALYFKGEGYCDFDIPIYSSVSLAAEKLTIKSLNGQNIDAIDASIQQFVYGEIIASESQGTKTFDFVENTVTVRLTKKEGKNISENISLNEVSFHYGGADYPIKVNVTIYPIAISPDYPTVFDNGGILSLQYSDTEQRILAFIGNPTSSITLQSYQLLSQKFLKLKQTSWQGKEGIAPVIIEGNPEASVYLDQSDYITLEVYMTFEFKEIITPWNSDVFFLSVAVVADKGLENYNLLYTVQCNVDLGSYYDTIYNSINESGHARQNK